MSKHSNKSDSNVGVWFTYGEDFSILQHSVNSFRTNVAGAIVVIIDEGGSELSREQIEQIKPDHYEVSKFKRNGNLRGWECVTGMLRCFSRICNKYAVSGVHKIDSDSIIRDLSWVNKSKDMVGSRRGSYPVCYGPYYWISKLAADKCLSYIKENKFASSQLVPEDLAISATVMYTGGNVECQHMENMTMFSELHPEVPLRGVVNLSMAYRAYNNKKERMVMLEQAGKITSR